MLCSQPLQQSDEYTFILIHLEILSLRPESIENRWEILCRDNLRVYGAFPITPYKPTRLSGCRGTFSVENAIAGTGRSTLALACFTWQVNSFVSEPATLYVARAKARGEESERTVFVSCDLLALPMADKVVDNTTTIALAFYPSAQCLEFIQGAARGAGTNG